MKILIINWLTFLSLVWLPSQAQQEPPKGYKKGTVTLTDGTSLSGFFKDNIRSSASLVLSGDKKKNLDGIGLSSAAIDSIQYICIKGDFFRVICPGNTSLLQKSSDASHKPTYNGSDVMFLQGTEGSPGDYFTYDSQSKGLKLIPKKSLRSAITQSFADCAATVKLN